MPEYTPLLNETTVSRPWIVGPAMLKVWRRASSANLLASAAETVPGNDMLTSIRPGCGDWKYLLK